MLSGTSRVRECHVRIEVLKSRWRRAHHTVGCFVFLLLQPSAFERRFGIARLILSGWGKVRGASRAAPNDTGAAPYFPLHVTSSLSCILFRRAAQPGTANASSSARIVLTSLDRVPVWLARTQAFPEEVFRCRQACHLCVNRVRAALPRGFPPRTHFLFLEGSDHSCSPLLFLLARPH